MPNTNTEPAATIAGVTLGAVTILVGAALALLQVFDVYDVSTAQNAGMPVTLPLIDAMFTDEAFARSPEYLEISKDRWAGANTTALLVRGL